MRQQIFSAREEQTYYSCKGIKSLYILRTLRNEGYNQSEIDLLFNTIVLPNSGALAREALQRSTMGKKIW